MDQMTLALLGAVVLALVLGGAAIYFLVFAPRSKSKIQDLMDASRATEVRTPGSPGSKGSFKPSADELSTLNTKLRKSAKKKKVVSQDDLFFRAGLFTVEDRRTFHNLKLFGPVFLALMLGAAGFFLVDYGYGLAGLVIGGLLGVQLPTSYIERKIARRNDDIMFYLPLVIEQIVIGVSSSLDTGPCIARVVEMADERNSHNPVTELLRHAQQFSKSGVSFEESMNEVGALSGHPELKHAFKSLAQVAKHGGEISRQLQELADSVSSQRETLIEGKIKRLELEATGPVGLVFFGFMIIFFAGLGAQIMKAFE